jgi:hypothetical protein
LCGKKLDETGDETGAELTRALSIEISDIQ